MGAVMNDRHEERLGESLGESLGERLGDAGPYVLGAALAALILPAMVLGLSAPLWLGVATALAVLIGVVGAAKIQHRRQSPTHAAHAPVRAALDDAAPALDRLETAAAGIRAFTTRVHVARIADAARLIVDRVSEDPSILAAVQRVLTYYLPRAAAIAESYRVLEARGGADPARVARMEAIIARLDTAFQHYADRLADDALRLLDLEIRLMDGALKDDLGSV